MYSFALCSDGSLTRQYTIVFMSLLNENHSCALLADVFAGIGFIDLKDFFKMVIIHIPFKASTLALKMCQC